MAGYAAGVVDAPADRSRLPDLPALALLLDVAHSGSIGAAGRRHGISQQAASARLRQLELTLGVPLLRRGARGSELTPAGSVIVEWADRLMEVGAELVAAADTLRVDQNRELVVYASMTVAEFLLPGWLVQLRHRQRRAGTVTAVALTATNSEQVIAAVRDGRAQLGFVEGLHAPADLRSIDLDTDHLVLAVAPGPPWQRYRALTPAQVADLQLTSRELGSGTREVVERALAAHDLAPAEPDVELRSSAAVRETIRAGGQPGFLSRRTITQDPRCWAAPHHQHPGPRPDPPLPRTVDRAGPATRAHPGSARHRPPPRGRRRDHVRQHGRSDDRLTACTVSPRSTCSPTGC